MCGCVHEAHVFLTCWGPTTNTDLVGTSGPCRATTHFFAVLLSVTFFTIELDSFKTCRYDNCLTALDACCVAGKNTVVHFFP